MCSALLCFILPLSTLLFSAVTVSACTQQRWILFTRHSKCNITMAAQLQKGGRNADPGQSPSDYQSAAGGVDVGMGRVGAQCCCANQMGGLVSSINICRVCPRRPGAAASRRQLAVSLLLEVLLQCRNHSTAQHSMHAVLSTKNTAANVRKLQGSTAASSHTRQHNQFHRRSLLPSAAVPFASLPSPGSPWGWA